MGATLRRWAVLAATPGSAHSLALAAAIGVIAFAGAVGAVPSHQPVRAAVQAPAASAPAPLTPIALQQTASLPASQNGDALAPVGAPPLPAIDRAFDYPVVFFWPATPQTVVDAAAIREGPSTSARVLRSARPGDRLRINGRVANAPSGPWWRVRLPDGRDGYLSAHTMDVAAYRRKRAAETAEAGETPDPALADVTGAPLMPTPPDEGPDPDISPPSF